MVDGVVDDGDGAVPPSSPLPEELALPSVLIDVARVAAAAAAAAMARGPSSRAQETHAFFIASAGEGRSTCGGGAGGGC